MGGWGVKMSDNKIGVPHPQPPLLKNNIHTNLITDANQTKEQFWAIRHTYLSLYLNNFWSQFLNKNLGLLLSFRVCNQISKKIILKIWLLILIWSFYIILALKFRFIRSKLICTKILNHYKVNFFKILNAVCLVID